jgi:hypothetical protein
MARRHDEKPARADPTTVRRGERTNRQKLLSAARAVQLEVDEGWDDKQLEAEIRAKATNVDEVTDPATADKV